MASTPIAPVAPLPDVTAHDHSNVHVGNVYNVHQLQSPEGIRSHGLCWDSAPLIDDGQFVGRDAELDRMAQDLRPSESSIEQRRLVIGGLGGMGKTQLAIAFARRHQSHYDSTFWLNATSEETLKTSFGSVALKVLTTVVDQARDDQSTLHAVFRWLGENRNSKWLLIYDNHDDPDLYAIQQYIPNTPNGSLIITTRLPDLVKGQKMRQLRLRSLGSINESLMMLETRSQRHNIHQGNF